MAKWMLGILDGRGWGVDGVMTVCGWDWTGLYSCRMLHLHFGIPNLRIILPTNLVVALSRDGAVHVGCHSDSFDFRPDLLCDPRLILCIG